MNFIEQPVGVNLLEELTGVVRPSLAQCTNKCSGYCPTKAGCEGECSSSYCQTNC